MYSCARLSLLFLGFLLVSLYQQGDSSLLGHVDLSEPTPVWNTLSICPTGLTNDQNTGEKLLFVVGKGSELSFTVQIAEGASEIALDQPHTVNVQGDEVSVFQFIPPQDISDKQLDITVTSQSTVAAYLKVSQNCKEVDVQKDLESINYKKESLRLSFATKGRITLSSFSIPPLMDSVSRWFIGISLKNLSGDVKLSESKNVTLKLTRSFDYNYATPSFYLFVVSLVAGTLVSIIAYFLFEECLTQVKPGEGDKFNYNTDLVVLVCKMWEVIRCHWFSSGPKTYSHIIGILGIVLMIGAFQFVLSYWDTMIQEGNRDNCYYNDFCYRVANHDIPFNLMISNLTYIIHGLILAVWVLMLEAKVKVGENEIKGRYPFSIGYTFSWALVFQGLLSALCNLCPNRFTYLFELVFMFVIAVFTVLFLLYNGIKQNSSQNEQDPDGVTKFFVLLTVSLIFHYVPNSRPNTIMQGFFYVILIIWWLEKALRAFCKLNMHLKFVGIDTFNAFFFILGGLLISGPISMFYRFSDPDQMFSMICTFCIVAEILTQAWLWEKLFKCKFGKLLSKGPLLVLFISLTSIIWVAAVLVFILRPTTNKTSSPENSRDQNKECVILGFFDWHDLWHFLSSFALLMSAFVVMFISFEPEQYPQAEIQENKVKEIQENKVKEIPKKKKKKKPKEVNLRDLLPTLRQVTPLLLDLLRTLRQVTPLLLEMVPYKPVYDWLKAPRVVPAKTRGNKESSTPLKKKRAVHAKTRGNNESSTPLKKKRAVHAKTRGNNESSTPLKKKGQCMLKREGITSQEISGESKWERGGVEG